MQIDRSPRKRGRAAVADRLRILRRDEGRCRVCRGIATQVDHIIPLFKGGQDKDDNKQAICDRCHTRKTILERGGTYTEGCDVSGMPRGDHHWK